MSKHTAQPFQGYSSPNYTPVPDELFDEQLPDLSGAELKALLYIIRRTFGFKKESDNISLSQMLHGITTRDGQSLDRGVGLSKKTLLGALRSLEEKRIIMTHRRQSVEKGNEPTAYRLNVLGAPEPGTPPEEETPPPLGEKLHQGVGGEIPPSPRGKNSPTQETVLQDTVEQKTENRFDAGTHEETAGEAGNPRPGTPEKPHRRQAGQFQPLAATLTTYQPASAPQPVLAPRRLEPSPLPDGGTRPPVDGNPTEASSPSRKRQQMAADTGTSEDRDVIAAYLTNLTSEFGDRARPRVSLSRALHLYEDSGMSRDAFVLRIGEAASLTRESRVHGDKPIKKPMAYFFTCLEELLAPRSAGDPLIPPQSPQNPTQGMDGGETAQRPDPADQPALTPLQGRTDAIEETDPAWKAVLGEMRFTLTEANFQTWLAPTRVIGHEGDTLRIGVPRQFHADWLDHKLRVRITSTMERLGYGNLHVEFVVT